MASKKEQKNISFGDEDNESNDEKLILLQNVLDDLSIDQQPIQMVIPNDCYFCT